MSLILIRLYLEPSVDLDDARRKLSHVIIEKPISITVVFVAADLYNEAVHETRISFYPLR